MALYARLMELEMKKHIPKEKLDFSIGIKCSNHSCRSFFVAKSDKRGRENRLLERNEGCNMRLPLT